KLDLRKERELADLIHGASMQGLIESAHDLSEGGLAIAIIEASLRFNVGCRIWLGELMERDSIDATAALFSESQSRVIVSVGREDDVKFQSLCEARGVSVLRIGVTDKESAAVDIQSIAKLTLADIRKAWSGTIPQVVQ
ncbi:MAG: phosphoribosylformylglycinamidine synthase subunit PurL, partial [Actinomycetota bacterium]